MVLETRVEKRWLETPVSLVEVYGHPLGIRRIAFLEEDLSDQRNRPEDGSVLRWERMVDTWFEEYFSSGDVNFSPLLQPEGTDFQKEVWKTLREIPPGQTRTYGEVASQIGREGAARAVGQACGRNPIPILIPCHRVVPAAAGIGAYSGPDDAKQALLEFEAEKGNGGERQNIR